MDRRRINKEIVKHLEIIQKLETEKEIKYQEYAYFLTKEYEDKLKIVFNEGYDNHKEFKKEVKILYEIILEYTSLNNNIKNNYNNSVEKIKLFNFTNDNKIYLLLVIFHDHLRYFKTYIHDNNENKKSSIPSFNDLKEFVKIIIKNREEEDLSIRNSFINSLNISIEDNKKVLKR